MSAFGVTLKPAGLGEGLIFATDNNIVVNGKAGVCCAMTADWISKGIKLGRPVKTAGEMSGPLTWSIGQGYLTVTRRDEADILRNAGLAPGAPTILDPCSFVRLGSTLASRTSFVYFSIGTPDLADLHAMGVYVGGGMFDFFDPNFGLFRCKDALSLSAHVYTHVQATYPTMTGSCYIYQF